MMEENIKTGEYYKHFKGKNIYRILATNVTYTGTQSNGELTDLVIYQNIKDGKVFAREAEELLEELDEERQKQYHQKYRIVRISEEEALKEVQRSEEER